MQNNGKDLILKLDLVEKDEPQVDNPIPLLDDIIRPAVDQGLSIGIDIGRKEGYDAGYQKGYEQGGKDAVKHGQWITYPTLVSFLRCNRCQNGISWHNDKKPNFCPYCGAIMGVEDNEKSKL